MKRRRLLQHVHPLGPLLLAAIVLGLLWPLQHFFGVGQRLYELAIGAVVVFGGSIIITLAVAGLVWGGIKLFGRRK